MQEEQQKKILGALQLVLRPIIKILLRYGIGFSEFAETVKTAYVDVGSSDFGIRGRPTNISRVAVMTGLTRKEVRRLRTKIEEGLDPPAVKTTPITEILHRWHSEKDYLDSEGRPAPLPFSGDGRTFSSLVRRFGGDVPPGAMRTELKRVGAISESGDGELTLQDRLFAPDDLTEKLQTGLVHTAYPLLATICNNTDSQTKDSRLPQYTAFSEFIPGSELPRLRRICRDRLRELSQSFDDLFIGHEAEADGLKSESKEKPVAVGLFYFEERDENAKYEW